MTSSIWTHLKEKLPFGPDSDSVAKREKYWKAFDINKNGYLNLAEVDKGVRDVLQLPQLFQLKPVLIKAFSTARHQLKNKTLQYYQYWIAFDRIDTSHDHKIELVEFKKAVPMLKKWGIKIKDPQTCFKQIDEDHGGQIIFIEFVHWAIKKHLELDDDDLI